MAISLDVTAGARGPNTAVRLVRLGAALVCAVSLSALLLGTQLRIDHDMRVIVAATVAPGGYLPIRVLLYRGLHAVEGPSLFAAETRVELRDGTGRSLAHGVLREGLSRSLEGVLAVPRDATGVLHLQVTAVLPDGGRAALLARVTVAAADALAPQSRALRALQQLSHGAVQRAIDGPAEGGLDAVGRPAHPAATDPRLSVSGGACVPEQLCELWVAAAGAVAGLQLQGGPAVTVDAGAQLAGAFPVLRQTVTTHGPEAQVGLRVQRTDGVSERRAVRLPIALGSAALAPGPRVWAVGQRPELQLLDGDPAPCIVDAFVGGHWIATGTAPRCGAPFRVPFALPAGVVRLQVRRDPFSENAAAVRVLALYGAAEGERAALSQLARAGRERFAERENPAWAVVQVATGAALAATTSDGAPSPLWAPYLAALIEEGLYPLPAALSDHGAASVQLSARRRTLRWLALSAVVVAGTALVLMVGRSGLVAGAEAQALMSAAGAAPAALRRARRRRLWALGLSLLALCLSFLAIGLYVLVRTAAVQPS